MTRDEALAKIDVLETRFSRIVDRLDERFTSLNMTQAEYDAEYKKLSAKHEAECRIYDRYL